MIIHRFIYLLVFMAFASHATAANSQRPNILVIVSDDQGYADAGFQGSKDIPTPHLDQLASSGIRFTNGYASHPYCSPTRAGLLTGRYPQRFGMELNPAYKPDDNTEGLPVSETLLPEILAAKGYVTGWVGKWHLGAAPIFTPGKRGFQETYGIIGGSHKYQGWKNNITEELTVPVERNGVAIEPPEHLTIAQGKEAAAFVRRHPNEPWFLYLALSAPHTPNQPTAERLARFASITNETRRSYAAQVSLMDDAIGETLGALQETKQNERTLVFFFSDNGGAVRYSGANNSPLRDEKGTLFEGGIRVPFLMSWPTKLASGKTSTEIVSSMDVFATALGVAGIAMPTDKKYDSVNLMPFLTGENTGSPHEQLLWRSGTMYAMREGNWKLVHYNDKIKKLYDMDKDIGEKTNLAALHPEVVARMDAALMDWNKELKPQAFKGTTMKRIRPTPESEKEIKKEPEQKLFCKLPGLHLIPQLCGNDP